MVRTWTLLFHLFIIFSFNVKYIRLIFLSSLFTVVFFGVAKSAFAYSQLDISISTAGVIEPFSVACTGTNATALLLHGQNPFSYSVNEYMRRACVNGVANFDSFDLAWHLSNSGGAYPVWLSYYRTPLKLVVKDTTDVYSYDAPIYHGIISLVSAQNNYNHIVLDPADTTYLTLATNLSFSFDGSVWKKDLPPPPPPPPEPIGDPNNLPVSISPNGDIPRVSINCLNTHNYTLSLVHRTGDDVNYSLGVIQRKYCGDSGIVSFDVFNLNDKLNQSDPSWWNWIHTPLEYIIKDTTGLYFTECDVSFCTLIAEDGAFNGYDHSVYLASSTYWTTVGKGPIFDTSDHTTWFNIGSASSTPSVPTGNSNILFLPGLEASRLYEKKTILGVSIEDQLWEPNGNSDVQALYLNTDGTSIGQSIYTRDIIKETNSPVVTGPLGQNIYKSFSNMMDDLVSDEKIAEWKAFAYDWRESPEDIVNTAQKYDNDQTLSLIGILQSLVNSSQNGKVTIIGHSNGGIIAKLLIKKLQDDKTAGVNNLIDHIDILMLVASPQLGTPTAIPALLHGYDQDLGLGFLLNKSTARELGRNMPSAYTFLPSREYFNHVSTPVISFVPNYLDSWMSNMISTYGENISNYSSQNNFLIGAEGRANPSIFDTLKPIKLSQNLLTSAENLHNTIDTMTMPENIRVIQIAGWGLDTVAGFKYETKKVCQYPTDNGCTGAYILDERPIFTADGDKTVVTPSALAMGGEKWWVDLFNYNSGLTIDREHKNILEASPLLDFISNVIQDITSSSLYISTTTPIDTQNRLRLSVHSPVTLDAYDTNGNHTGKICPPTSDFCYIEENIPNSGYYEFGEGKYLNLPEDSLQKVTLHGTDVGTFTFESQIVAPSGDLSASLFIDIPVITQTQAEITLNQTSGIPELKLDVTGDGVSDFTLAPSATFDPILYLQIMKVTINSLDITSAKKKVFSNRIDNIIKSIQKGKINKAELKAEKFKKIMEKTLSKADPKKPKPKKLSKTDAQLLLDMLNQLLDNIS